MGVGVVDVSAAGICQRGDLALIDNVAFGVR